MTNLVIFTCIVLLLGFLFWAFGNSSWTLHTNFSLFRTLVFFFVLDFIKENCYIKTQLFFPIIFHSFLFISFGNFIGMVPYSVTVTSSAMLAFFLSFMYLFGITRIGYKVHGFRIFGMLFPSGVPLVIAPFLVGIELISYISRTFSLAIRLFANMMSGHALLKILASFVWALWVAGGTEFIWLGVPFIIVFLVTFLELVIAFLQAYVFTVLVSIYLNDLINLH